MKNIKIILNENKTFVAENIDEVKILEDEHNATVIEVHFPTDYINYSKRVDSIENDISNDVVNCKLITMN